jgi:riboflavin kinase/FMN adenylyltransferase
VGPNPTFGEHALKVEVHLIDFDRPLYGEPLEVEFLSRLRDVQTFSGVDALRAQLQRDIAGARQLAADGTAAASAPGHASSSGLSN